MWFFCQSRITALVSADENSQHKEIHDLKENMKKVLFPLETFPFSNGENGKLFYPIYLFFPHIKKEINLLRAMISKLMMHPHEAIVLLSFTPNFIVTKSTHNVYQEFVLFHSDIVVSFLDNSTCSSESLNKTKYQESTSSADPIAVSSNLHSYSFLLATSFSLIGYSSKVIYFLEHLISVIAQPLEDLQAMTQEMQSLTRARCRTISAVHHAIDTMASSPHSASISITIDYLQLIFLPMTVDDSSRDLVASPHWSLERLRSQVHRFRRKRAVPSQGPAWASYRIKASDRWLFEDSPTHQPAIVLFPTLLLAHCRDIPEDHGDLTGQPRAEPLLRFEGKVREETAPGEGAQAAGLHCPDQLRRAREVILSTVYYTTPYVGHVRPCSGGTPHVVTGEEESRSLPCCDAASRYATARDPKVQFRNRPRLVVSLTTIPSRLPLLHLTVSSLLAQTVPPDAVYLHLPKTTKRRFSGSLSPGQETIHNGNSTSATVVGRNGGGRVPGRTDWSEGWTQEDMDGVLSHLRSLSMSLIINECEDFGPATKLIPTLMLEHDPDTILMTVDDDMVYKPTMIERLLERHVVDPGYAYANAGQMIDTHDEYGDVVVRSAASWVASDLPVDILEAFLGALYKRSFFDLSQLKDIPGECWHTDDIWISAHLSRRGIPRIKVIQNPGEFATFSKNDNVNPLREMNVFNERKNDVCATTLLSDFQQSWLSRYDDETQSFRPVRQDLTRKTSPAYCSFEYDPYSNLKTSPPSFDP